MRKNIAIFASGSGTNTQAIAEYFQEHPFIHVDSIFSNNPQAFVLERAKKLDIPSFVFTRDEFFHSEKVVSILHERQIDLIVLAGFLWLVPENLIRSFKIVNIHPALLPKHGGKGMYGMKVHEAVVEAHETESGITIHYIDDNYDKGQTIFQAKCPVLPSDTAEMVATKVHALEYQYFAKIIEEVLTQN